MKILRVLAKTGFACFSFQETFEEDASGFLQCPFFSVDPKTDLFAYQVRHGSSSAEESEPNRRIIDSESILSISISILYRNGLKATLIATQES